MPSLSCLIVDDSPHFVAAASALFAREGIAVTGVATTIKEALRQAEELQPDFALLDIHLGGESGFDLARRLECEIGLAPSRIIFTSTHAEDDFADMIETSRAAGFVPKSKLSAAAIRDVLDI